MDDSRLLAGSSLWIWILLAFLLFSNYGRAGTGVGGVFGGGLDCAFPNLFGGCGGSSTWMWIIIAILAYMLLAGDGVGTSIFRNEIQ